jgi:hypothetical protein
MRTLIIGGALVCAVASSAHATCGTRGGPGFRDQKGHCVGWTELGRTCGSPPTLRCTAELKNDGAEEAADFGVKALQAKRPKGVPNQQ